MNEPYAQNVYSNNPMFRVACRDACAMRCHTTTRIGQCQPAHRPPMSGTASASALAPSAAPRAAVEAAPIRTRQAVKYSCTLMQCKLIIW